ncbi:MAG: restriction endonuclease subunit S, partial [Prevotellaceae bacterium]|nr:restriction endonuclease subunit S [Prevotellaceae bacterium]
SGVTTSIFIFTAGVPQGKKEIFTCYMAEDGLETIKNQGRQDIRNRWDAIEDQWVEIVQKQSGHESVKWIKPDEHLSYQEDIVVPMPVQSDFMKRTLAYALFKYEIDEAEFFQEIKDNALYGTPLRSVYENIMSGDTTKVTPLCTDNWKHFEIGKLFKVDKGQRLTKADQKEGSINYVGASAFNNGITNHIGNTESINPAGTISVCYNGSIGESFYQDAPYWATDDVNVLTPQFDMNQYIALFICAVIKNESVKYAFNNKWTKDIMEKSQIPLPVAEDGTPDYKFMEEYIKSLPYSHLF